MKHNKNPNKLSKRLRKKPKKWLRIVPFITIFVAFTIYLSAKIPNKLKYFMISGALLYQFFAYVSLYYSNNPEEGIFFKDDHRYITIM